jgi:hypothetical protein
VLGGGVLLLIALAFSLIGLNLQTYQRLGVAHQCVAIIEFTATGQPDTYRMSFMQPADTKPGDPPPPDDCTKVQGGVSSNFDGVHGDQWLMRARVLKWQAWATVLGLDAQYRLDSLDGTWSDQQTRRTVLPTVTDLRPARRTGIDFLPAAEALQKFLPFAHIQDGPPQGKAVYQPLANGAKYFVYLSALGDLSVMPADHATETIVTDYWAKVQAGEQH